MVCIYCGGRTQVTNSRPQKRLNRTWRRRECLQCDALFSTSEAADYENSIVVRKSGSIQAPFSRDKLFASVLKCVGHRQTAVTDAGALTDTIIARLLASTTQAVVSHTQIVSIAHEVLKNFDTPAAVQYMAYHQM
jgi:transcriptional repressor NrdR